jgi:hypothetical protein
MRTLRVIPAKRDSRWSSVRDPLECLRLSLILSKHGCTIKPGRRWQWATAQGITDALPKPEGITAQDNDQAKNQYRSARKGFGEEAHTTTARLSYYFIAILRFCAFKYPSVTLKCGVGRLVGGPMNGERCAHCAVSPDGELSPKTSGTRSELSEPFACPLEGCESVTSVTQQVGSPNAHRPRCSGKGVRHEGR